jgi:sodium-dependent dicarboxylate transporter 2/3/5
VTPSPAEDAGPVEAISPGEALFEQWRARVGIVLGPLLGLALYAFPPFDVAPSAQILMGIMAWVGIYWITEPIPIPVTALLGVTACVVLGIAPAKEAFAPFGHPVIFLLLGSFLLAQAMMVHGVDRRVALWFLSRPTINRSPARILVAFGAITAFLSMWVSNTAATAMMYPIALGILASLRRAGVRTAGGYGTGVLLMIAYAASVGGIGTLIGTPTNLIGAGIILDQLSIKLSFLDWMAFGVPILCVSFLALAGLLLLYHRPPKADTAAFAKMIARERHELGPWRRGEVNAAIAFGVAVSLWVLPGAVGLIFGVEGSHARWVEHHLPEGIVALLAAGLLFLLPVDYRSGEVTLSWADAVRIDWGTIVLFGGGLALSNLMFQTGLSAALGKAFMQAFQVETRWGLTLMAIAMGVLMSELASNTASAGMVVPLAIAIAQSAGIDPFMPAMGACLGASFGFMLPISTPPNAIVYASGLIPVIKMIRAGIIFDLLGIVLIWGMLRLVGPG